MIHEKQSDRIVGSLLVADAIRCFTFDLAAERLELDTPKTPNPDQATLDPSRRERFERTVRGRVGTALREIRYGEYHCPQCRRWIDVTKFGKWSRGICAQCSLDHRSELHEHYAAAPSRKKPATASSPSPSSRRQAGAATVRSAQPTVGLDDDQLGELIYLARADRKIKAICLLSALGTAAVTAIIWPDFNMRFGGLAGWALTLWSNPAFAAPGLIVVAGFGASIWALARFVYYLRLRVEVREYGIRVRPGRQALWEDIEEIRYAKRRLHSPGACAPGRESLQLRPREGKPINLPHRFRDMRELISVVGKRVEPRLLENARGSLELEGSVSFGPLVTITRDGIMLGKHQTLLPFDRIKHCGVTDCQFAVLDRSENLVLARSVELIPNAAIIGPLVDAVRQKRSR